MGDAVRKPSHYQLRESCDEVRDVIRERTTGMIDSGINPDAAYDYTNAIKYLLRWWGKDGIQDLEKAKFCIDGILEVLEKDNVGNIQVPSDQPTQYVGICPDADNISRGC